MSIFYLNWCWNSTSGFDFHVYVANSMSFFICLPNFIQIEPSATELWCHIHFSRWRLQRRNSTSCFVFCHFNHLWRSKSNCRPNFGEISQSTAEILLRYYRFEPRFSVPSKIDRKFPFFKKMGSKRNFSFGTPKSHVQLRETTSFSVMNVKIGATASR